MARKRPKFRRFLARCAALPCVLIAGLWIVDPYWRFAEDSLDKPSVAFIRRHVGLSLPPLTNGDQIPHYWIDLYLRGEERSFALRPYTLCTYSNGSRTITIALYIPFLAIGIPTAVFFIRNRRRFPPGHCAECGYNLTGNVSGMCPECGTEVVQP